MIFENACGILCLALERWVTKQSFSQVGVYYDEGPPVPIPNTVVKLIRAENTWREAAREDRSTPTSTWPKVPPSVIVEFHLPPTFNKICPNSSVGRLTTLRSQCERKQRRWAGRNKEYCEALQASKTTMFLTVLRSSGYDNRICPNSSVGRARGC